MRDDSSTPNPTDAIFTHIKNFETFGMYNTAILQDMLLYPFTFGMPPGGPVPPVWTQTWEVLGEVPTTNTDAAWQGGGPIGADVCVHVKMVRVSGSRNGKHFFRAWLEKNDVKAPALGSERTYSNAGPPGDTIQLIMQGKADTELGPYMNGMTPGDGNFLGIVHTHKSGGVIVSAAGGKVATAIVMDVADLQRHKRR